MILQQVKTITRRVLSKMGRLHVVFFEDIQPLIVVHNTLSTEVEVCQPLRLSLLCLHVCKGPNPHTDIVIERIVALGLVEICNTDYVITQGVLTGGHCFPCCGKGRQRDVLGAKGLDQCGARHIMSGPA